MFSLMLVLSWGLFWSFLVKCWFRCLSFCVDFLELVLLGWYGLFCGSGVCFCCISVLCLDVVVRFDWRVCWLGLLWCWGCVCWVNVVVCWLGCVCVGWIVISWCFCGFSGWSCVFGVWFCWLEDGCFFWRILLLWCWCNLVFLWFVVECFLFLVVVLCWCWLVLGLGVGCCLCVSYGWVGRIVFCWLGCGYWWLKVCDGMGFFFWWWCGWLIFLLVLWIGCCCCWWFRCFGCYSCYCVFLLLCYWIWWWCLLDFWFGLGCVKGWWWCLICWVLIFVCNGLGLLLGCCVLCSGYWLLVVWIGCCLGRFCVLWWLLGSVLGIFFRWLVLLDWRCWVVVECVLGCNGLLLGLGGWWFLLLLGWVGYCWVLVYDLCGVYFWFSFVFVSIWLVWVVF